MLDYKRIAKLIVDIAAECCAGGCENCPIRLECPDCADEKDKAAAVEKIAAKLEKGGYETNIVSHNSTGELKPCPFCGGKAEISKMHNLLDFVVYRGKCTVCGMEKLMYFPKYATQEEIERAVKRCWNERVTINEHRKTD